MITVFSVLLALNKIDSVYALAYLMAKKAVHHGPFVNCKCEAHLGIAVY